MSRLIAWFVDNSVAANLLMLVLLAGGLLSLPSIRQEQFPSIDIQVIQVSVAYPGASPKEVEEAMKRDPLVIHRAALTSHGVATDAECDEIEAAVKAEIDGAVEFARNSPFPEASDLFDDMWATPV